VPFELCEEFDKLNLRIIANTEATEMEVGSRLLHEIRRGQLEDEKVQDKSETSRRENHLVSQRMMNVCCGTREGFVCLTLRN
jgi:hypothetical protein